ncbi:MAG: DUF4019 domain-containing protein [Bacteroidota bacterium]
MRLLLCASLLSALVLSACGSSPEDAAKEQAATEAALQWLALLDQEAYATSWDEAGGVFQAQMSAEGWVQTMQAVMAEVGTEGAGLDLTQRQLVTARYTDALPEAPPGEYVLVQFATAADTLEVLETVTLHLAAGEWKVQGYYIVPGDS